MVGAIRSTTAVPVQASTRSLRFGAGLGAAWWLSRRLWRLAVITVTTPAARAAAGALLVALVLVPVVDGRAALTWLGLLAAALVVWWRVWPATFRGLVLGGLRSWGRDWLVYRHRWPAAMDTAGLGTAWQAQRYLPTLLAVHAVGSVDRVRVRMLPGQTVEDWTAAGPRLAQTFGASSCTIRSLPGRPHEVALTLLGRDPLLQPVEPLPAAPGEPLDTLAGGLPLARAEDGTVWRLRLVGSHLLVVGATGAGKGSVIWSLLWPVMREVERHLAGFVGPGHDALVFTAPEGGPLRRSLFARRVWTPAVRSAGLGPVTFHGLRHSFVAILVAAGCNVREVSEWAGHNNVAFTLTRYGGLFEDGSDEAVDRLDALLGWPEERGGDVLRLRGRES